LITGIWLSVSSLKNIQKIYLVFIIGAVIGLGALARPSLQYFIIPLVQFFLFSHKGLSFQQQKKIIHGTRF